MGNFEKLSVLVIVVIIVMILVVALYTWSGSGDAQAVGDKELNNSSRTSTFASVGESGGRSEPGGTAGGWDSLWNETDTDTPEEPGGTPTPPDVDPGVPTVTEPVTPAVTPTVPPASPPVAEPGQAPPVSAGADEMWIYTVKSGDTISQICERELGTWRRQKEVFDLNPGLDPLRIRVGDKIKMPPRGRASSLRVSPSAGATPAPTGSGTIKLGDWYIVQQGDRMTNIAKRAYGSIDRWPELWARNLSVVKDPDDVQPGTRIFIPR